MATQKQIEANRRNALKSTGPRSWAGKARASLNRTTHGAYALRDALPAVDDPEFVELLRGCWEEGGWPPAAPFQRVAVEMALGDWEQDAAQASTHALELRLLEAGHCADPAERAAIETECFQGFDVLSRREFQANGTALRAVDTLRVLLGEDPTQVAAAHAQLDREDWEEDEEARAAHRSATLTPRQRRRRAASRETFIREALRVHFGPRAPAQVSNWVRTPDLPESRME